MTIPVLPFDRLKVVTMVIITVLEVNELNLPAIFALLPVTNQSFGPGQHLQRKQGKVKFTPGMNVPGEILSMRYNGHVRGIVRSETTTYFPHTIILDIGTSARIVSVKLAKTIELTGPPSFAIAREAVEYIIEHIKNTAAKLELIRQNLSLTMQIAQEMIEVANSNPYPILDRSQFQSGTDSEIRTILADWVHGYPIEQLPGFLNFIVALNLPLYTGELKMGHFESEMINVSCELGFPINRVTMAQVMNTLPFSTSYNNARSSRTVKIRYRYTKHDRTTGKPKDSHHTITVNLSGYVTHSGPNFESMEMVYNSFIRLVLQNLDTIQSSAPPTPRKIKYLRCGKSYSVQEYNELLAQESQFREKVLNSEVPLITEVALNEPEPVVYVNAGSGIRLNIIELNEEPEALGSISFDYQPILSYSH